MTCPDLICPNCGCAYDELTRLRAELDVTRRELRAEQNKNSARKSHYRQAIRDLRARVKAATGRVAEIEDELGIYR